MAFTVILQFAMAMVSMTRLQFAMKGNWKSRRDPVTIFQFWESPIIGYIMLHQWARCTNTELQSNIPS